MHTAVHLHSFIHAHTYACIWPQVWRNVLVFVCVCEGSCRCRIGQSTQAHARCTAQFITPTSKAFCSLKKEEFFQKEKKEKRTTAENREKAIGHARHSWLDDWQHHATQAVVTTGRPRSGAALWFRKQDATYWQALVFPVCVCVCVRACVRTVNEARKHAGTYRLKTHIVFSQQRADALQCALLHHGNHHLGVLLQMESSILM